MSLPSWFRLFPARKTRRPAFRPRLTALEERSVPSFGWAAAVGGNTGNAVATDAAGNVYLTGSFSSSFTPAGSNIPLNSAGLNDIFVTKYTRSGAFVWAVSMGGAQNDSGNGIAVDGAGTNVYVAGQNSGGSVTQLNAATGAVNWSRTVAGSAADAEAVDGTGSVYVTSHGTAGHSTLMSVTKLGAGGAQQWQDTITSAFQVISGAGVAVTGNTVYVGGVYNDHATLAIGSSNYSVTAPKNSNAGYVLKLSGDNAYGWVQTLQAVNGNGDVVTNHIAADSTGNVYAFSEFTGKVNFAASIGSNGSWVLNAGKSNDADAVTKLTPAGSVVWAKQFGSFPQLWTFAASAIAVDGAGAVYLTGYFYGTVSFNPAGGGNLTSAGGIFVSKLDTNGTFQWAVQASATAGNGIAVDSFGDIDVTGYIAAGTYDFDPTHTYGDNRDLVTTGTGGGFLWQITQP